MSKDALNNIVALCKRRGFIFGGSELYGGLSSTGYALKYNETSFSSWAPLMWPIKSIMTVGILLMLLQAISIFFKDLARVLGRDIA